MWWIPGRCTSIKDWEGILDEAFDHTAALLATTPDPTPLTITLTAPTIAWDGRVQPGTVQHTNSPDGRIMAPLLRPLLARSGAAAPAWTTTQRGPAHPNICAVLGTSLISAPIGTWTRPPLPARSAHASIDAHAHPVLRTAWEQRHTTP